MSNLSGRPKGIIESEPRKQMARRCSTDSEAYGGANSGCVDATLYLKHSSLCLECPFQECKLDFTKRGREKKWKL